MNRSRAFTLIELLAVVAIIAVLAAILFPTIGAAKRHAREPDEIARLRQVYLGLVMYEDDGGEMPPVLGLARLYVGDDRPFATAYSVVRHAPRGPYPPAAFTDFYKGASPFPIDFGYLKTYPPNDENRARWRLKRDDPLCGLVASPWAGEPFSQSPRRRDVARTPDEGTRPSDQDGRLALPSRQKSVFERLRQRSGPVLLSSR